MLKEIYWEDGTRYVLFGAYEIEYYKEILSVSLPATGMMPGMPVLRK